MHRPALLKAIRWIGSQSELARRVKVPVQQINHWLNRGSRIPFHHAITLEALTRGEVSCYDLAPYARPTHRREDCLVVHRCLSHHLEDFAQHSLPQATISQRVKQAVRLEKAVGWGRGGNRHLSQIQNFGFEVGQTLQISIVKSLGFGNSETYRQARYVVEEGSLALIAAMDKKLIAISLAAKLAKLPPETQVHLLQYHRKDILRYIKAWADDPHHHLKPFPIIPLPNEEQSS
jgi:DNA-binding transcriptional regulator YdaS (Cro superfamily)